MEHKRKLTDDFKTSIHHIKSIFLPEIKTFAISLGHILAGAQFLFLNELDQLNRFKKAVLPSLQIHGNKISVTDWLS